MWYKRHLYETKNVVMFYLYFKKALPKIITDHILCTRHHPTCIQCFGNLVLCRLKFVRHAPFLSRASLLSLKFSCSPYSMLKVIMRQHCNCWIMVVVNVLLYVWQMLDLQWEEIQELIILCYKCTMLLWILSEVR